MMSDQGFCNIMDFLLQKHLEYERYDMIFTSFTRKKCIFFHMSIEHSEPSLHI